jgi:hypothetical protein
MIGKAVQSIKRPGITIHVTWPAAIQNILLQRYQKVIMIPIDFAIGDYTLLAIL